MKKLKAVTQNKLFFNIFQKLNPALRTRYFLFSKENELRQMLRSGLKQAY